MPRPLKWGILGASTIILSKDIAKYAFMSGSNFFESDVISNSVFGFSMCTFRTCQFFKAFNGFAILNGILVCNIHLITKYHCLLSNYVKHKIPIANVIIQRDVKYHKTARAKWGHKGCNTKELNVS